MSTPILATKLYIPPPQPQLVIRPHLLAQLNAGLQHKLTLISAPAGFGKTTLVSSWVARCLRPVAWLSLDEGECDPARFLSYLVAAVQTLAPQLGAGVLALLSSPQPPSPEALLTMLLNDFAALPAPCVLVLDDYHLVDSPMVVQALGFLLEHMPPQLHLAIITREDPTLPLARLRAHGQLSELRLADLRFTQSETTEFLTRVMRLSLSAGEIAALEARTEGWVAGLQLAAISLRGHPEAARFIASFTGSHQFVLDYLLEEVLHQQPERVQTFLLRSAILERMCGPLCDVLLDEPAGSGQATLSYLERANLFIVPLDNERRWYRYHHLFAELLRQRLMLSAGSAPVELHRRASTWFEQQGLELEAFQHAAAANDVERAERLIEGKGMPLLFRGAVAPILSWLASLPATVLDARPGLWVTYASALLFAGQLGGVEQKVQAAEAALQGASADDRTRDLIGHMAAIRATLAVVEHQAETIIAQSRRALEHLHPNNLPVRTATTWTLGYAHQLQGERAAASQAYAEAIAISQMIGHGIITLMATIGLGEIQESENQLSLAAETYRRALDLAGEPAVPNACDAQLGLARVLYQWNEIEAAQQHAQQGLQLARQFDTTDRAVVCELFLARLALAQGDLAGAAALVARVEQIVRQHQFFQQLPALVALQVLTLLRQAQLSAAAQLAQTHDLPLSQARVMLAQGDPAAALAALEPFRQQTEARSWADERLKAIVLEALAHQAQGAQETALQRLAEALALAQPGGFIRIFVDEGPPMAQLLAAASARGLQPDYAGTLLAALAAEQPPRATPEHWPATAAAQPLAEPLSAREQEVLQLIAQGLSNAEISERLFLSLHTVKGHNQRIFDKLQVQRRTEAVARARALGLV